MNKNQHLFLHLSVIKQMKYEDIQKQMNVDKHQLSKWWDEFKTERERLTKIRKLWLKKCVDVSFVDFEKWYSKTEKKCHYCSINEEQIKTLIAKKRIYTKRISTRGKTLEIERKNPNDPYDNLKNLVFSCYWCNNSKTDEFTENEFQTIGKMIQEIWKKRLQ